ncbi:hypothetical protein [Sporosarcina sp. FA9]|uniref:hypothetical protein n=1 Tax=Sporosarcina sp. FA9 TaxID=3413030 RepID=UPI003F6555CE
MGYLLPIRPIQSEQYANRLSQQPHNFAYIGRIQRVKFYNEYFDEFQEQSQKEEGNKKHSSVIAPPSSYQGYIQPNPVNLSPAISRVVGKGMNINAYV